MTGPDAARALPSPAAPDAAGGAGPDLLRERERDPGGGPARGFGVRLQSRATRGAAAAALKATLDPVDGGVKAFLVGD